MINFFTTNIYQQGVCGSSNGSRDCGDLGEVQSPVPAPSGARLRDILGGGQLLRAHARHDVLQLANIQVGTLKGVDRVFKDQGWVD